MFTNSVESAIITRLAGIVTRIGYRNEGRSFLLTTAVDVPEWKSERHEVYFYRNLAETAVKELTGVDFAEREVSPITLQRPPSKAAVEKFYGVTASPFAALGVGSVNSRAKRWPAERYAELTDRLFGELGLNVIIVGTPEDAVVADKVAELSASKPKVMAGKTTLSEAIEIMAAARVVVSNDMGLAHIAPAVGTPTVVIFGPTNEKATAPFSNAAKVVRHNVECSPCMLRDCPIDHRCMTGVSVDEVFEAVKAAITSDGR